MTIIKINIAAGAQQPSITKFNRFHFFENNIIVQGFAAARSREKSPAGGARALENTRSTASLSFQRVISVTKGKMAFPLSLSLSLCRDTRARTRPLSLSLEIAAASRASNN